MQKSSAELQYEKKNRNVFPESEARILLATNPQEDKVSLTNWNDLGFIRTGPIENGLLGFHLLRQRVPNSIIVLRCTQGAQQKCYQTSDDWRYDSAQLHLRICRHLAVLFPWGFWKWGGGFE